MSTIVEHVPQNGTWETKVLVKGAPEAIEKLLKVVPKDYEKAYRYYTQQGYRLLALAQRKINPEQRAIEDRN